MRTRSVIASCLLVGTLSGCVSLPSFAGKAKSERAGELRVPRVDAIVKTVQCELFDAVRDPSVQTLLAGHQLAAAVDLTLEVTDDGSINPSLSFVHKLSAADTNRKFGLGLGMQGAAHRTYTEHFTLILDKNTSKNERAMEACSMSEQGVRRTGLQGKLGLKQILWEGLIHNASDATHANRYFLLQGTAVAKKSDKPAETEDDAGDAKKFSFGSTIDFTVVANAGFDPVWTLTDFVGPGGGSSALLYYQRTNKDTLVISFAEAASSDDDNETEKNKAGAVKNANEELYRQILKSGLRNR